MVKNDCRDYFKAKGLSYDKITAGDICTLVMILNKHIKQACKEHAMSVDSIHMSEKIKSKYSTNGKLKECYLYMNSHYFTYRECISFNPDGFIGFMGWADERNTAPVLTAFKEWCDALFI